MLQVFVNDLSTYQDACNADSAVQRLNDFCSLIRAAHAIDQQILLNLTEPLAQLSFGDGWPLPVLRNIHGCADESTYLKTIKDRSPIAAAFDESGGLADLDYRTLPTAVVMPGVEALALGATHKLNGLAISFASHAGWSDPHFPLVRTTLDEHANLVTEEVVARNAVTAAHVELHGAALSAEVDVVSGAQMWERRAELFPHLSFIPRTRAQLEALLSGEPQLRSVLARLKAIDVAIGDWRVSNSEYPMFGFNMRPESQSRMHLPVFSDSDGVQQTFSLHADFAPGEGRIHIQLRTDPQRHAVVGHVGKKLGIG